MPDHPSQTTPRIKVSVCHAEEEPSLRDFLRDHWRRDHVFVQNPALLAWQHGSSVRPDSINFIVARDLDTEELVGCLGFVPPSQFDPALAGKGDYWWAIFKVRNDQAGRGVGKQIIHAFEKTQAPVSIGGFGLSEMVIPIYRKLGFRIGRVHHYYMVNPGFENFLLLGNFDGRHCAGPISGSAELLPVASREVQRFAARIQPRVTPQRPHKSPRYFFERYGNHPWYDYLLHGLVLDGTEFGLLVTRSCIHQGATALRVVDYWGDHEALSQAGPALQSLLERHQAEYLDVYNLGVDPGIFARAGLIQRPDDSTVVVPNYFEPFTAKNVNLDYMLRNRDEAGPYVLFKGDSDQDRPSIFRSSVE
jgi:GNAT superfamily N-acetyltransferase